MADFFATALHWFEVVRFPLGGAVCLLGAILCGVGTVGVLRFPDFYTRLHAASVTDTSGAILILIGMALLAPGWLIVLKLLAIFVFILLTSPAASHAVANAAHTAGLQPLIGPVKKNQDEGDQA